MGGHLITDAGTDLERQVVTRHGDLGLERAFRVSCNNTFARAALELSDRRLRAEAEKFGYNYNFLFRDMVVENSSYPSDNRTDREVAMTGIGAVDWAVLGVTTAVLFLFALSRRGVTRGDGLFLLVMYIGYTAYLVASQT